MIVSIRSIISFFRVATACLSLLFFFAGCSSNTSSGNRETTENGTIHISVDETFKPIIDSQIKVFESSFPNAHIIATYKSEAECLRDLTNDSIRMVIVTRKLNDAEEQQLNKQLHFTPIQGQMANDAIAVIQPKGLKDSILDMTDIRSLIKGTSGYPWKVVMDGLRATSTVRYVLDSLAKGAPLGKNVVAAQNSLGVIDYVSNNKDAIGLVGVSWIGNPEDSAQTSFLQKVQIASIECMICNPTKYVQPFQYNIATKRYPMVRGLYYILKENYEGLGSGFANFLIYERGQKIFRRAYLWPTNMSFEVRNADLQQP